MKSTLKPGPIGRVTHGGSSSRLYRTWDSMKARCNRKSARAFPDYGGRGISICSEWNNSFIAFQEWAISSGYKDDLTLDRIDVNGNYEPTNCRWATRSQQMGNTRKRKDGLTSAFKGVGWNKCNKKWRAEIRQGGKRKHLGYFKSEVDAALAYDAAAKIAFGEYANVNFSENTK